MHSLNLLPWREMQQEALRRKFFTKLGLNVGFIALIVCLSYGLVYWQLNEQHQRNSRLEQEIRHLNETFSVYSKKKMTIDDLSTRLEIVNSLQNQRNNTTSLFNLLPNIMPEGVVINKVVLDKGKVQLEGFSRSNAELATLLATLEKEPEAKNVRIHSIINKSGGRVDMENSFVSTFELVNFVVPKLANSQLSKNVN